MTKPLTEEEFPPTFPYGLATSGATSKGPTAEALKRAMSRLGKLPWREFDQHYNQPLEAALDSWDPGGKDGYGKGRWEKIRSTVVPKSLPHAGELALDDYSIKLVQDEAGSTGTNDEAEVQNHIADWWKLAAAHAPQWTYDDTFRPGDLLPDPDPTKGGVADCSLSVIYAHAWAKLKSGLAVPDPSKQNWSGYGNTDVFMTDWPKISAPFRIGDLMHFTSSRHVIECISPGDAKTALWGSNGREAAPELFKLGRYNRYPGELLFTVRPALLS